MKRQRQQQRADEACAVCGEPTGGFELACRRDRCTYPTCRGCWQAWQKGRHQQGKASTCPGCRTQINPAPPGGRAPRHDYAVPPQSQMYMRLTNRLGEGAFDASLRERGRMVRALRALPPDLVTAIAREAVDQAGLLQRLPVHDPRIQALQQPGQRSLVRLFAGALVTPHASERREWPQYYADDFDQTVERFTLAELLALDPPSLAASLDAIRRHLPDRVNWWADFLRVNRPQTMRQWEQRLTLAPLELVREFALFTGERLAGALARLERAGDDWAAPFLNHGDLEMRFAREIVARPGLSADALVAGVRNRFADVNRGWRRTLEGECAFVPLPSGEGRVVAWVDGAPIGAPEGVPVADATTRLVVLVTRDFRELAQSPATYHETRAAMARALGLTRRRLRCVWADRASLGRATERLRSPPSPDGCLDDCIRRMRAARGEATYEQQAHLTRELLIAILDGNFPGTSSREWVEAL